MIWLLLLAAGELADLRAQLATRDKRETIAALERLARSASSERGEAAAWRGQLAQQDGDLDGAAIWYAHAISSGGEGARLGHRGLGDLAVARREFRAALQHYSAAAGGAGGVLAEELRQKRALAERSLSRQRVEWAAWIFLVGVMAHFALRAARGQGPLRVPLEAIYVLPVYALLVVGALGRDAQVVRALGLAGAISLALIAAAGLAARRAPPGARLRLVHATLLVAANLALFYAVLNRTGLVDTLIVTAQM